MADCKMPRTIDSRNKKCLLFHTIARFTDTGTVGKKETEIHQLQQKFIFEFGLWLAGLATDLQSQIEDTTSA